MTSSRRTFGNRSARRTRRSVLRLRLSVLGIAFVLSLFAARLFQLQGVDASAYASMAQAEGTRTVTLHAARGAILDRNGVPLASSTDAVAITADPTLTTMHAPSIAAVLANRLHLDYFDTVAKLRTPNTRFVYLQRRVPSWRAAAVLKDLSEHQLTGVFTERDPLRTYPEADVAATLVGLVGASGDGTSGLEQQYNSVLKGVDGQATYVTSPAGEHIPMADSTVQAAQDGTGIVTTIDRDLQWYADRRLAEAVRSTRSDWGAAVTIDVQTGQIYQFSQFPSFNPNRLEHLDVNDVTNRGISYVYEPGSVEKLFTYSALADSGQVDPRTHIVVPGVYNVDGFAIQDDWSHGTIHLTATGALAKSSNIAAILASQRVSKQTLASYLHSFGLGSPTSVGLPGESGGILAAPSTWSDAQHATIAFGQGLSVTALQMAAGIAAIANGGEYVQPTLVSGYLQPDGSIQAAPGAERHRVISARAARMVATMMTAVTQNGGTAPLAAIPGYRVAGKTGTAQRVDPTTGTYAAGQRTISFAGFAPADAPRFMTYVVLDNPKDGSFGGTGAAPVFHDIMTMVLQRYGIPPTGAGPVKIPLQW